MSSGRANSRVGLAYVEPGKRPSARDWNAMVDYLRGMGGLTPTDRNQFTDQHGAATRPRIPQKGKWVRVISDDLIPVYGIAEAYDGGFDRGDYFMRVRKVTDEGRVYVANENVALFPDTDGWAKLVTASDPVQVRADEPLSFLEYANVQDGSDNIVQDIGGGLLVVASSNEDLAPAVQHVTGVIQQTTAPALIGKSVGPVLQGSFSNVEIWGGELGVPIESSGDLIDIGRQVEACFLFGACSGDGLWVGLVNVSFMWVAWVIECPASS